MLKHWQNVRQLTGEEYAWILFWFIITYVFFFTGSDWCGWCIRLQKEVFFKPEFAKWANENLVLVELDFPRRKKLDESLRQQNDNLRQMFGVRGYPTGWIVVPEIEDKQVNFKRLGSQGYVKGGPSAWIAGANKMLMKK